MAEQTQLQQVTMKDPKKVEAGKRLAEYSCRKREELAKSQKSDKQTQANFESMLWCWGHCSHWGVRHFWLLCLLIQERRCYQDDSGSLI